MILDTTFADVSRDTFERHECIVRASGMHRAVVCLPRADRWCGDCRATLPAGMPCGAVVYGRARKWTLYFCLHHAPVELSPLSPERAWRFVRFLFAGAKSPDALPESAWRHVQRFADERLGVL